MHTCCTGRTITRREFDSAAGGYVISTFYAHNSMCVGLQIWNAKEELATDRPRP